MTSLIIKEPRPSSGLEFEKPAGDPEHWVESIDWHRNGVSGEGFFVALVHDKENGLMVVTRVPPERDEETGKRSLDMPGGHGHLITVLNVALLVHGNIRFFENSWRGDHYLSVMDEAIAAYDADMDKRYNRVYPADRKSKEGI